MKGYLMGLYFDLKENECIEVNLNSGNKIIIHKNDEVSANGNNTVRIILTGKYSCHTIILNIDFVEYICLKEDY